MSEPSSKLRLFIDSPDSSIWQHLLPSGLFYGVTTNSKLLNNPLTSKAAAEFEEKALAGK